MCISANLILPSSYISHSDSAMGILWSRKWCFWWNNSHTQLNLYVSFCKIDSRVFVFSYLLALHTESISFCLLLTNITCIILILQNSERCEGLNLAPEKLSAEIYLCTETLHKNFIMQVKNFIMRWIWGSTENETSVPLQLMHSSSYILYSCWKAQSASRMVLMCTKAGKI